MNYIEQIKMCSKAWEIANNFDYILDNICSHKSMIRWREIEIKIPEPYRSKIGIKLDNIWLGRGNNRTYLEVKNMIEKYLNYLMEEEIHESNLY